MSLQTVLEGVAREQRLPLLWKAYRPERRDVAEALLDELELRLKYGSDFLKRYERREFDGIMETLKRQAKEAGDIERVRALGLRYITSHFYADDIESAAKSSGDQKLIEKVVEMYRGEYFNKAEMVINLLEHLGRKEEARAYSLEAAQTLRRINGGCGAVQIYLRLGMDKEAIEVKFDNKAFEEAIRLAQNYLSTEELPQFYKRVFAAVEGEGYDHGFPFQVKVTKLLGDEELERTTKKRYVDWIMGQPDKTGYLSLVREVGTAEQLRELHKRRVAFYQQGYIEWQGCSGETHFQRLGPEELAQAAEEAYKDTQQMEYATIALKACEQTGNFLKALEFARLIDSPRAKVLEEAVGLMAG